MQIRKILAAFLLAVMAAGSPALAQPTPAASKLPWNGYVAQRIPDGYVTIVGQAGTSTFPNSQTSASTGSFTLAMPFPFRFINQDYIAGATIRVFTAGYISFTSGNATGVPNLNSDANQKVIAPYWSDLQANQVAEGGVFWRVDGIAGSRVLTVEWRVMGVTTSTPTRNPGNFQAKLYEGSNKIEFFYGPYSINRSTTVPTNGAVVGLKNLYQLDAAPGSEDDSQKFLLLLDPDQVPDTVALTRTRFGAVTTGGSRSETYAAWPTVAVGVGGGPSPYFHYKFPTQAGQRIGYRISSIASDVAPDQVLFDPTRPGNAYVQGSSFLIRGLFRNYGANIVQNVPVELQILRGNTVIETRTGNAFPSPTTTNGTSTVVFSPPFGSTVTALPGTYTARLITRMTTPADQDPVNDTLNATFFVIFQRDVMATEVLSPVTFTPDLPVVYPVGSSVPVEGRFLNIGTTTLTNVPIGYVIRDGSCNVVFEGSSEIRGSWAPLETRDIVFEPWPVSSPGQYYVQIFTKYASDEQVSNDTIPKYDFPICGRSFTVRYQIDPQVREGTVPGVEPVANGTYPLGRPLNVRVAYRNNGITDATNVPARVEIRKDGNLLYSQSLPNGVPSIPGEATGSPATVLEWFPYFVPNDGPGTYCVTATVSDPNDPVSNNNTSTWCFTVAQPLSGTIYVGTGERFRTIQEASDALSYYGVSGPVTFKLVDDNFIVRPQNDDPLLPALDARGDVIGSGPNSVVTWMAAEGKTNVRITLKSPSGTGIIYGQRDTLNPTGYITWDGGPERKLTFVLDTAGNVPPVRAIPFLFSQGSSNFTVRNVNIMPATVNLGRKDVVALPMHVYTRNLNTFRYEKDDSLRYSTGIFLRNTSPSDNQHLNYRGRDTLFNENNVFEGNVIKNFATGITSMGAGPLYRIGHDLYTEYNNRNNKFINNTIDSVTRAGIVVAFESNSEIGNNTITNVRNSSGTIAHAAGIWVAAGGMTGIDVAKNRGYSTDLVIQRNRISKISAVTGNAGGIWVETNENFYTSGSRTFRFPVNGASNHRIWNNMVWDYRTSASTGINAGVGLTMAGDVRDDFVATGNRVDNNTVFNQIATTNAEYGIVTERAFGSIRNNIISILSPSTNPIGLVLVGPNIRSNVVSDYNLFWVPNGYVGALSNMSVQGYNLPSPPSARTLNQWRALSHLDDNSLEGNVAADFVSTTPGAEDLHIRPGIVGSLANNRGVAIVGMTMDVDGDPRGSGGGTSRPDIGADEFNGIIRNNDVLSEDILSPAGYRPASGQFSDAEYVMTDSLVNLTGRFRNMGGLPQLSNTVRLSVEYYNPTTSSWIPVASLPSYTQTTSFDVAQSRTINFGNLAPRSLRQVGINDSYYGSHPNVSPIYRFRITSGTDDFSGNNIYEKEVRFYIRRSHRNTLVSVENRTTTMPGDVVGKSNKLNTDTLMAALNLIRWERADGAGLEDYDLFDRDMWPKDNLNFLPWKMVIWEQGAETQGLIPEERAALKVMLDSRNMYNRSNLIIAGQDVVRIHDVALNASNGAIADQDFVNNYLRASYRGSTTPGVYNNRVIRGVAINPGKYERIVATGVSGDNPPTPSVVRPTVGDGIARPTHHYWEQDFATYVDSAAGVASASQIRNVIYYAIDWRHYGRFNFEADRSGAQRLLLAALDFADQYQGVVPVKVMSFEATQSGRKAVRVEWATASESDVASLEIERAVIERTEQGVREGMYTLVDRKAPAGSVTRGAKYNTLDQNVEVGVEYRYRLVSVGLDGSRTIDATDEVKIIGAGEARGYALSVMPNPARDFATIELRMPESGKASVKLYDATGRLVRVLVDRSELDAFSTIELNVEGLASGVYTVTVETATTNLVQKINVQK